MTKKQINAIISQLEETRMRNILIIDYGNVQKWEESLGWKIGIKQLGNLVKHFTIGKRFLRRFYYGSDYGRSEKREYFTQWSQMVLTKARMNNFEIITKPVKYMRDSNYKTGFVKKCNFDTEMSVDLIKEHKNYDAAILFSGDGDMAYVLTFLKQKLKKRLIVFGARGHVGKELYDANQNGIVEHILYAEDFDYRLNMRR